MSGTESTRSSRDEGRAGWSGTATALAALLVLAAVAVGIGVGPAVANDDEEVAATFNATGTEGFVAINENNTNDPISFPTPDEVDTPISIEGVVFTNGTWKSTDVTFPDLGEEQLGFPIEILLEAPRPFRGEINRETGLMTVDAALDIIIPDADEQIDVQADLTTGESGEMTGETAGLDTDSAAVTLVGNEFALPQETGDTVIDGFVGLPAPDPGTNWFSLTLEMDIETSTGTVAGVVESAEGDPVEGATVTLGDQQMATGADGAYEFESPVGSQTLTVERFGFADATESVTVGADETTTVDVALDAVDTGTVAGVVESAGGDPVEGATVTLGGQETQTAADGSYELPGEVGTQEVTVAADGFSDASQSVTVAADAVSTADVELEPSSPEFSPVFVSATDAVVGETVEVTALVQNIGFTDGTEDVTLAVGEESVTEQVELAPNQLETVTFEWETTQGDEGTYEASVTAGERTRATDVVVEGPEFSVTTAAGDVAPGDAVSVAATVRNDGDVAGTREVTISLADADGTAVESVTEQVDLAPGEESGVTLEWETTEDDAGEYEATVEVGSETATESVFVDESINEADFVVRSTGGYMAYGYDSLEAADGQGLDFPDKNAGEDPIKIWGVINDDGTWESTREEFPMITQEGLDGTVETVDGLEGEIDRENGLLTATATYLVIIEGDEDTSFTFNMTMTTAASGEMTGNYNQVNDTFTEVRFVSNDYPVTDQTGDSLVDATLSLPSEEPSRNYMELGFEVNFDPDEQPGGEQDPGGSDDGSVETEPSGTIFATVGQGVGFLGLGGVVLVALGGLYARVSRVDTDVEPKE
jgi:hypothetical protein